MKILFSPTKTMMYNEEFASYRTPVLIKEAEILLNKIKKLNKDELNEILKCNEKLLNENYDRYNKMDLHKRLSQAIFSYNGIQYKYLCPQIMEEYMLEYLDENLRIISGLYGVVKPLDAVTNYRLEMGSRLDSKLFLYEFWKDKIYKALELKPNELIINMASDEYSKAVIPYIKNEKLVTVNFLMYKNGKYKRQATYAKQARGLMVAYMAKNQIYDINEIKNFNEMDFRFNNELSNETNISFVKADK